MATHSSVLAQRIPGMGSLVSCHLWGRTESDTTEATQQQQDMAVFYFLVWVVVQFSLVQFSRSVVSDSLRPHESQHARPPCYSYFEYVLIHVILCLLVLYDTISQIEKTNFYLSKFSMFLFIHANMFQDPQLLKIVSQQQYSFKQCVCVCVCVCVCLKQAI